MHFRSLLFNGLLASAVLFFPADAFAENDGEAAKPNPNEKAVEATAGTGLEESGDKSPSEPPQRKPRMKGNPADVPANPLKSAAAENDKNVQLPDQASGEAEQAVEAAQQKAEEHRQQHEDKRAKPPVQPAAQKKNTKANPKSKPVQTGPDNGEHKGQSIMKTPSARGTGDSVDMGSSSVKSLHNIDSSREKSPVKQEGKKKDTSESRLEPAQNGEKNAESIWPESEDLPSEQPDRHPADAVVFTSQVNSSSSGGSSKDRTTGSGQSTSAFFDKWLELNMMMTSKVILPYISGSHIYFNQWMNAPPSPPPKKAPFLYMTPASNVI